MVGLAENIQACLRIFRRAQHQWLVRDICINRKGFFMFLSYGLIGQLLHMALCCLEGSTLSNLVHRRRRCARISKHTILCLEGSTPQDGGLSLFIALRWMQEPDRVMVWVAENIQACLRIFRRAQHQWLVRDILHLPQGVFAVFVLWPHRTRCLTWHSAAWRAVPG